MSQTFPVLLTEKRKHKGKQKLKIGTLLTENAEADAKHQKCVDPHQRQK